jgi:hypothetical protein
MLIGKSGSGKTTLLTNLIFDKRFYDGTKYFSHIFLFSPTALGDDVQKALNIPESCIFTELMEEGLPALKKIQEYQAIQIKEKGALGAKQICVIFDDVIGNLKFMHESAFIKSFIACRHFNCTTFLCSQHFTRVPRVCRLQANYLAFFAISNSEAELLVEEFSPPGMHKKQFMRLIYETLHDPFTFLGINMKVSWETRFRKNLGELINLNYYMQ